MTTLFTPLHLIFYLFSLVAVISALFVVTARHPVRSVLALVVTFFAMAGVWMILRAEFLSLILILVYVGAVMTLFLFVLMMINIRQEDDKESFVRYLPFGILVILLLIGILMIAVSPAYFGTVSLPPPGQEPANYSNTTLLGELLFTTYVYPFEIAGVMLLAAIIAAITLTHRKPRRRVQYPEKQVEVTPADRLRIIKMAPEKKEGRI